MTSKIGSILPVLVKILHYAAAIFHLSTNQDNDLNLDLNLEISLNIKDQDCHEPEIFMHQTSKSPNPTNFQKYQT